MVAVCQINVDRKGYAAKPQTMRIRYLHMAYGIRKTEHTGPKKGSGAYWGPKAIAKKQSNKVRRRTWKLEVQQVSDWSCDWNFRKDATPRGGPALGQVSAQRGADGRGLH